MAGFKTHITVSTLLGAAYGAGACMYYHVPLPTCVLASGLCSVSGMLPDLDSDSGVPLRESLAFAAAVVPMMLADRLRRMNLPAEYIVLAGAAMYLAVRFVLAAIVKRWTIHRGMCHSLPAAVIFGELAFLLSCGEELRLRWVQAGGVVLGFLSHLVLDELWSVGLGLTGVRVKRSFGTAIKLFGEHGLGNFLAYAQVGLLTFLVLREPNVMHSLASGKFQDPTLQAIREQVESVQRPTRQWWR